MPLRDWYVISAQVRNPTTGIAACCARRERPSRRTAERDQQFPPSDGDCHTPLPREVRKGNDTTPRRCSLHVQGRQECWLLPPRRQIPVRPSKEPIQRSIVHLLGS